MRYVLFILFLSVFFTSNAQEWKYVRDNENYSTTPQATSINNNELIICTFEAGNNSHLLSIIDCKKPEVLGERRLEYSDIDENITGLRIFDLAVYKDDIVMTGKIERFFPQTLERVERFCIIHLSRNDLEIVKVVEEENSIKWGVDTLFGEVSSYSSIWSEYFDYNDGIIEVYYRDGNPFNRFNTERKYAIKKIEYDIENRTVIARKEKYKPEIKDAGGIKAVDNDGNIVWINTILTADVHEECIGVLGGSDLHRLEHEFIIYDGFFNRVKERIPRTKIYDEHAHSNKFHLGNNHSFISVGYIDTFLCGIGGQWDYHLEIYDSTLNRTKSYYNGNVKYWSDFTDFYYDSANEDESYYLSGFDYHILGDSAGLTQSTLTKFDVRTQEEVFQKRIDFPNFKALYLHPIDNDLIVVGTYFPFGGSAIIRNMAAVRIDKEGNVINVTNVNENQENSSLVNVYPNPTQMSFTISISAALSNPVVVILDQQGRTLLEKRLNVGENELSLDHTLNVANTFLFYRVVDDKGLMEDGKLFIRN